LRSCLIIFLFLAKHLGVVGRELYDNDLVLRVGLFTGFLGLLFFILEGPGVVANFHGKFWVCWQRIQVIRVFYMAHVCGLDTAA
jgi:hypothetical protein